MTPTIKSLLTPGLTTVESEHLVFESSERRATRTMCEPCIHGAHTSCDSERCPCVCNDSDFRFSRTMMKSHVISEYSINRIEQKVQDHLAMTGTR